MSVQQVVFIILSAITLLGALGVVLNRRLFRSALFLVLSFVGVAGFYILLEVELLAMIQLLIYVGAIAILIIFAIMLSRQAMAPEGKALNKLWVLGEFVLAILTGILLYILISVESLTMKQRLALMGVDLILIILAVLLSRKAMAADDEVLNDQWIVGGVVAVHLFALLIYVLVQVNWPVVEAAVPANSIQRLGETLMNPTGYVLPFEVASVLLLVALVGAVIIAREK